MKRVNAIMVFVGGAMACFFVCTQFDLFYVPPIIPHPYKINDHTTQYEQSILIVPDSKHEIRWSGDFAAYDSTYYSHLSIQSGEFTDSVRKMTFTVFIRPKP